MKKIIPLFVAPVMLILASCGQDSAPSVTDEGASEQSEEQANAQSTLPQEYLSSDCKVVLTAYATRLKDKDFRVAAMAWADDTGVTSDTLALRFENYGSPVLTIGETKISGVAETGPAANATASEADTKTPRDLTCQATVTLRDATQLQRPLRQGTVILTRTADAPDASPDTLRWRIQSSTLAEDDIPVPDSATGMETGTRK